MKSRRSVGAEPYLCAKQIEGYNRGGGGGDDTCDHGLYVQKLESRNVPKKDKKLTTCIEYYQSAISSQEHVKHETMQTYFVSFVPTRPLALDRQTTTATESGTTATTKHTAYISPKSLLGEKKHQSFKRCDTGTNACHSLVSSENTVYLLRPFRVAYLNNRRNDYFSPCSLCRKCIFPCFLVHPPPPHAIKYVTDRRMLGVIEHCCVWSYSYVPVLLAREYKACRFARTCIKPPSKPRGRSHSQCCCVAFWGAVIVFTTTYSWL